MLYSFTIIIIIIYSFCTIYNSILDKTFCTFKLMVASYSKSIVVWTGWAGGGTPPTAYRFPVSIIDYLSKVSSIYDSLYMIYYDLVSRRRSAPTAYRFPVRPIHLLRVSLLRVLESNIRTWEFPPFRIKSLLESNLLKSQLLVGKLGVSMIYHLR